MGKQSLNYLRIKYKDNLIDVNYNKTMSLFRLQFENEIKDSIIEKNINDLLIKVDKDIKVQISLIKTKSKEIIKKIGADDFLLLIELNNVDLFEFYIVSRYGSNWWTNKN